MNNDLKRKLEDLLEETRKEGDTEAPQHLKDAKALLKDLETTNNEASPVFDEIERELKRRNLK